MKITSVKFFFYYFQTPRNLRIIQNYLTNLTSTLLGLTVKITEKNYNYIKLPHIHLYITTYLGLLTYWLAKSVDVSQCSFLLVDLVSQRHKADNKVDKDVRTVRIKEDIRHLSLPHVQIVKESKQVVAVGKHVCGNVTGREEHTP